MAAPERPGPESPAGSEESLDPDDWEAFGRVAHQAVDDVVHYLRTVRDRRVWSPVPDWVREALEEPLPTGPSDLPEVYQAFRRYVLPYPTGNIHPRFWGWVMGTGTAEGVVADLLASAMNCVVAGYDQSAVLVERQVVRWMAQIFGLAEEAGGLRVSGGTMANITGVAVARGEAGPGLRLYGSSETHGWIHRCRNLLGLGPEAFQAVAVDADYRVCVEALREAVRRDRAAGLRPFCVVANAGTVNTGAVDDLESLADLCAAEGLWLHVDGALGGLAVLTRRRHLLRGLERADSIAVDLHKWAYMQYELGCVLVRDAQALRRTFQTRSAYLEASGRGIQPEPLEFADRGVQLSRGFRALRVWMSLKTHGVEKLARLMNQNLRQVEVLVDRIQREKSLELLAPVPLNVVCFRYLPQDGRTCNEVNREILLRVQESGVAVLSSTWLGSRFALRVAHTNHRTRTCDFDLLARAVLEAGREVEAGSSPSPLALSRD